MALGRTFILVPESKVVNVAGPEEIVKDLQRGPVPVPALLEVAAGELIAGSLAVLGLSDVGARLASARAAVDHDPVAWSGAGDERTCKPRAVRPSAPGHRR
jgi:hypothetical protein